LKDALDNGLIKPKYVVLLMCIFNCGGDGFYDCLLYYLAIPLRSKMRYIKWIKHCGLIYPKHSRINGGASRGVALH
jgi:hypothetical protein